MYVIPYSGILLYKYHIKWTKREIEIQACSGYKIRQEQLEYYVSEVYHYASYLSARTRRYPANIKEVVLLYNKLYSSV
jgi:hypothetical protein